MVIAVLNHEISTVTAAIKSVARSSRECHRVSEMRIAMVTVVAAVDQEKRWINHRWRETPDVVSVSVVIRF